MIRLRAVYSLLFEEVAELRAESAEAWPSESESSEDTPGEAEATRRAEISKARSRATLVAALDIAAILVLFVFRQQGEPFLVLGGSEQGVFTLGVLAIAVHAGYRLGQRQKLAAVLRAWDSLPKRYDRAPVGRTV